MKTYIARLTAAVLAATVLGCAGQTGSSVQQSTGEPATRRSVKRITAAIMGDPPVLISSVHPSAGQVPGSADLEQLVIGGLTMPDAEGRSVPQIADAVPTVENGLWRLLPDGTMETTWRLRPGARWHDGAPFTSADLAFTARVGQDKEVAFASERAYEFISRIDADEPGSITVHWRRPFVLADTLFTYARARPLPRHLLEAAYAEDRSSLTQLAYWSQDFVGTGPYRLRDWERGSHVVLEAFDGYVLGRPNIDEIEVKLISDASTLMANILAGAVELTLGRGLAVEQGIQLRDQWQDGKLDIQFRNWVVGFPQLLNPTPAAITDLRFRRALTHSVDRQEMADTLLAGLAPVAHSYVSPKEPEYKQIEDSIVRYGYDPRRATELLEEMGFRRGSDGGFRDASGQRLALEIRQAGIEISRKSMLAVAGYWQSFGIDVEPVVIPPQRAQDREYRALFPAYEVVNQPNDFDVIGSVLHSSQAPLAENGYRAPSSRNRGRYINPEYDALLDAYLATIPRQPRTELLRRIVAHQTERALVTGLVYNVEPGMIGKRLRNVSSANAPTTSLVWNAHLWDVGS